MPGKAAPVSAAMACWDALRRQRSSGSQDEQMAPGAVAISNSEVPRPRRTSSLAHLLRGGGKPHTPPQSKTTSLPTLGPDSEDHVNSPAPSYSKLNSPDGSPYTPAGNPAMSAVHTIPRTTNGPQAVDPAMAPELTPAPNGWARPNAHAAFEGSKTSQYIDKITSENEKLKRELKAEQLAREEEAKRVTAARSKAEDSRAEHQHLQLLVDTNARALERKDRKMEEMKAQLEQEVKRRKVAEERAEEALKMLGDTRSETQRQLALAYEQKHLAETNADTAREGYKRLTDSYEKKVKYITEQMNELRQKQYENVDKIKRQAIIHDQLQHELARQQRTENKMVDMMGQYKREHEKQMEYLLKEAEQLRAAIPKKEAELTRAIKEVDETRDKMKWVMTQHKRQL